MTRSNDIPKEPEKTAKIISTVEDGGQFGFKNCGNCGVILDGISEYCPSCGIKFDGIEPGPTFGGSDL